MNARSYLRKVIGATGVVYLAGRPSGNRQFDGWIDDVRIYDGILSDADIEAVRQQGVSGVPEPSSCVIAIFGVIGWRIAMGKRSAQRRTVR